MNTDFKKSFLNDIKKIADSTIKAEIEQVILRVEQATAKKDIDNLRKLKGAKGGSFYRIRVGSYRIGVSIENKLVTFVICRPRKDIYKFFP